MKFVKCFCPGTVLWLGVAGLAVWAALNTPTHTLSGAEEKPSASKEAVPTEKDLGPQALVRVQYRASNSDKPMSELFPVPNKDELKEKLSATQYDVCINKGTERAFTGEYWDNHETGTYLCRVCELPLFKSDTKFESGTGWPSFFQPVDEKHVKQVRDTTHGMVREETVCANCGSHLGHVFNDGPKPTGLRFCMNSASLKFVPSGEDAKAKP